MSTIRGSIINQRGDALPDVDVTFISRETGGVNILRSKLNGEYNGVLKSGNYTYVAVEKGYGPVTNSINIDGSGDIISIPVVVLTEETGGGYPSIPSLPGSLPIGGYGSEVEQLFGKLGNPELDLEAKVSPEEARQAIGLFSVANLMLAGLGTRPGVGGERDRTDVLGILSLYYGWQDKTLFDRMQLEDSASLWDDIEDDLDRLAKRLDVLQADVKFLRDEAKRQFNVGTATNVQANVQFPTIFRRYVDLASDPRLSIDLKKEKGNQFFDKAKLAEVFDLLRSLKEVIIQIVRSLSKTGTTATRRVNKDWADFETDALDVLEVVAQRRVSEDVDEKNVWAVMATLIGQNRDAVIPYVALGKHGAKLLRHALEIYFAPENKLDDFEDEALQTLFQSGNQLEKDWWTTKIRSDAMYIRRYPLLNWG